MHGTERMVLFALAGHHDDLELAVMGQQLGERGKTLVGLRGPGREAEIQQHDRWVVLMEEIEGSGPIARDQQVVFVGQGPF